MKTVTSDQQINHKYRTLAILMLAMGQTVVWATLFYVFPAMILRWESIHEWTRAQVTGALTLALLLSAIASPAVGRLVDRGYGPLVLSYGAACGALILFLLAWTETLWLFYLLWSLMGVALAACLYEPCFMLVTRAYGASAKHSIITITLIAGFASTISFPLSHTLATEFGWRTVLIVFSASAMFIGVPALYFGGNLVERHALSSQRSNAIGCKPGVMSSPLVIRLGMCFSLLAVVHGATLHHLLPVLNDRGFSSGSAVFIASLIGPMQVAGRLVMTALQKKASHSLIAKSCFLFIGMSMCLLFFSHVGMAVAVFFVVLFGGSYGVVSIIRPVITRDVLGDDNFGARSGYLAFFYLIGSAVSPYIGSLMWNAGGYDLMIPVLASLALAGLAAFNHVLSQIQVGADQMR